MQKRELAIGCQTMAGWQAYDGFRTVCVTSTMETKPCNTKNTEEMPDCCSQCVALTMDWIAAWFTLLTTHHTEDSNLLGCGAASLVVPLRTFGRILWPVRIIHPVSYPRGPESSAACCENLKFCSMLLGWQNSECNFLNTEHSSFLMFTPLMPDLNTHSDVQRSRHIYGMFAITIQCTVKCRCNERQYNEMFKIAKLFSGPCPFPYLMCVKTFHFNEFRTSSITN